MIFKDIDYNKIRDNEFDVEFKEAFHFNDYASVSIRSVFNYGADYENILTDFFKDLVSEKVKLLDSVADPDIWEAGIEIIPDTYEEFDMSEDMVKISVYITRRMSEDEYKELRQELDEKEKNVHDQEYVKALHLYRKYKDKLEKES